MAKDDYDLTHEEREARAKHRPKNPRGSVSRAEIERRRELVGMLWVEGYSIAEITRIVNERQPSGAQPWNRMTISRDVERLRAEWEKSARRSPENRKAELERMCRNVFKKALQVERPVVHRTKSANGAEVIRTEMVPAPDLAAANRAIERIAALYGLNVTTLDGQLGVGVTGLADIFGALEGAAGEAEPADSD